MGHGVVQDFKESIKWYRLAAEQGLPDAELALGVMYNRGKGVARDPKEGAKWFRLAAEQGNGDAQVRLGALYVTGTGVPQDYVQAHMWFNVASAKGVTKASEYRDVLSKMMTNAQIAEAQTIASRCEASHYKQCDESQDNQNVSSVISVPMLIEGGIFVVPVLITNRSL